jgi:hemerythrin
MAALLVWREVWRLGIDALDADHREMIRLLNAVFACEETDHVDSGPPRETESGQGRLVDRLEDVMAHLRSHFQREETFLKEIAYPGLENHQREHALEMAELVDLKRSIVASGARSLSQEAAEGIKRWFFNHVIAQDREFADFYHRNILG